MDRADWIRQAAEEIWDSHVEFECPQIGTMERIVRQHAPTWKPKPDAPGWWVYDAGNKFRALLVAERDFEWCGELTQQWYGPIPALPEPAKE